MDCRCPFQYPFFDKVLNNFLITGGTSSFVVRHVNVFRFEKNGKVLYRMPMAAVSLVATVVSLTFF